MPRRCPGLPLDITCRDEKREFYGVEQVDEGIDPREFAEIQLAYVYRTADQYLPFSFWKDQKHYVQMLVEKIDLRELFRPVCDEFRVPIANYGGWGTFTSEPT